MIGAAGPAFACPSPGPGKSRLSRVPNILVLNLLGESGAPIGDGEAYRKRTFLHDSIRSVRAYSCDLHVGNLIDRITLRRRYVHRVVIGRAS